MNHLREINPDSLLRLPPHLRGRVASAMGAQSAGTFGGQAASVQNVTVMEKEGGMWFQFDLLSRLMKDRIIFIGEQVSDPLANYVIAQMLYLQMQDPGKDISIYINSPGGSVTAGLAIYDTMQFLSCDVNTYCMGMAASMGAVLLCAGTKGKRYCLPNAHVMIHQVSGGAQGTASDVERTVEFMYGLKKRLNHIIAKHTGKTAEQVEIDADRDKYMKAEEACAYGLVDKVLENRKELPVVTP
jgi:ATP-dependent Clp protease protease subunit